MIINIDWSLAMRVIIFAGAPAVGKTAVILKTLSHILRSSQAHPAIAKMDCLKSHDELLYKKLSLPVVTGLSGHICPDHFLVINLNNIYDWALKQSSDMLIIETAGLCNRCAPFLTGALNICVIDSSASIKSPEKLGPMVTTADTIAVTKCDMISQAEREILLSHLKTLNPIADIYIVNGLSGSGSKKLAKQLLAHEPTCDIVHQTLIHDMPGAICSYCVGETRIGTEFHQGMVTYMDLGGA